MTLLLLISSCAVLLQQISAQSTLPPTVTTTTNLGQNVAIICGCLLLFITATFFVIFGLLLRQGNAKTDPQVNLHVILNGRITAGNDGGPAYQGLHHSSPSTQKLVGSASFHSVVTSSSSDPQLNSYRVKDSDGVYYNDGFEMDVKNIVAPPIGVALRFSSPAPPYEAVCFEQKEVTSFR